MPPSLGAAPSGDRAFGIRSGGFTLIEILVVLFMALLLVGLVVPHLGGEQPQRLRETALRFRNVLHWLRDQATYGEGEYRLRLDLREQSYHCERRLGEEWRPVADPLLRPGRMDPAHGRMVWVPYDNEIADADEVSVVFSLLGPERPLLVRFHTAEETGYTVSFRPEWSRPRLTVGLLAWGDDRLRSGWHD